MALGADPDLQELTDFCVDRDPCPELGKKNFSSLKFYRDSIEFTGVYCIISSVMSDYDISFEHRVLRLCEDKKTGTQDLRCDF